MEYFVKIIVMNNIYDLAIIGGGVAGVSAGVYSARKRLKTLFLTKSWDTQSSVSEGIENWIGTIKISGADFAKSLENHLKAYAGNWVDIKEGEMCAKISRTEDGKNFLIVTNKDKYISKTILITTGSRRRKLEIPGADKFEHKGLTYCASCDGPLFADMNVVVVGGGNAAFESASQLSAYCSKVTILNRSDNFRADESTVSAVTAKKNVEVIKNAIPVEVKGDKFVNAIVYENKLTGEKIELPTAGIFVEIGSLPATDFAKDVVELNSTGHIITDPKNQRSKTIGIWGAGDCTDGLYHQNNIASGDAVKALEDIYLFLHAR